MKIIILSFIALFIISTNIFAQKAIFRTYSSECSKLFNIKLKKPKGFKVIDEMTPFKVNEKKSIGAFYRMVLESKTKDCVILFPNFHTGRHHNTIAKNMVYGELKAALNLYSNENMRMGLVDGKFMMKRTSNSNNNQLDSAKYIKIVTGNNMEDYFNANTVFIYRVPLLKPYKNIYDECIGVNVIKKKRPSAIIKIFFTKECNSKEKCMQQLFKSIYYSNIVPKHEQEE